MRKVGETLQWLAPAILIASAWLGTLAYKATVRFKTFDARCWQQGDPSVRGPMIGDLLKSRRDLRGLTRTDIVTLLGPADRVSDGSDGQPHLVYHLDDSMLWIYLDDDDVSRAAEVNGPRQWDSLR